MPSFLFRPQHGVTAEQIIGALTSHTKWSLQIHVTHHLQLHRGEMSPFNEGAYSERVFS